MSRRAVEPCPAPSQITRVLPLPSLTVGGSAQMADEDRDGVMANAHLSFKPCSQLRPGCAPGSGRWPQGVSDGDPEQGAALRP